MVLNFGEKTMKEIIIKKNEAGQRFDKFLAKYMNQAPKSFHPEREKGSRK